MTKYLIIAEYEGHAPHACPPGQSLHETDAAAIWSARIERNARLNSPNYYGRKLAGFRLVAFRNEPPSFGDEISRNLARRALAGEGEEIALPPIGGWRQA